MYSVVLMMAMTTSVDTPDCHRQHGCQGCYGGGYGCHGGGRGHGCHGGYGSCYGGCYGGYSGCYGSPYGCTGGTIYYMPGTGKPEEIKKPPKTPEEANVPGPAQIIVNLPADAKPT